MTRLSNHRRPRIILWREGVVHRKEIGRRLSGTSQSASAVDLISAAGNPGGLVGGEKEDEFGNLSSFADPADWMRGLRSFEKISISLFAHAAAFVNLSDHNSGIHGVHAHSFRRQLQRRASR